MLCGGSVLLAAVVSFHSQGNQITAQRTSDAVKAELCSCHQWRGFATNSAAASISRLFGHMQVRG